MIGIRHQQAAGSKNGPDRAERAKIGFASEADLELERRVATADGGRGRLRWALWTDAAGIGGNLAGERSKEKTPKRKASFPRREIMTGGIDAGGNVTERTPFAGLDRQDVQALHQVSEDAAQFQFIALDQERTDQLIG